MITSSSPRDGFFLPLAQALTTGALTGLCTHAAARLLTYPSVDVAIMTGSAAALIGWLNYRAEWASERYSLFHPAPEPVASSPAPVEVITQKPMEPVKVILERSPTWQQWLELPGRPDQLKALGELVASDREFSFSTESLAGRGRIFSRSEYEALRAELVKHGLATWRNPAAHERGIELTVAGRQLLCRLAQQPPTP